MFALFDSPWLPIYLGILYLLHPMLGAIALGFAFFQVLVTWLLQRVTDRAALEAEDQDIRANELLFRRLRHVETVEAMGMLATIRNDWLGLIQTQRLKQERYEKLAHRIGLIATLMKQAQPSLILGAGALLAIRGDISLGAMAAAQMLMSKTLQPIDQLIAAWPQLGQAKIAYDRIQTQVYEGLDRGLSAWDAGRAPEHLQAGGTVSEGLRQQGQASVKASPPTALVLEAVSVKPPGSGPILFEDFSLTLEPGRSYALVGPSGIGKSTLAKLIVGVWQTAMGSVRWGGQVASHWDALGMRSSIGYLPQDVVLMEGSIAENIGRLQAEDAEGIVAAAQMAGVHEMILRMSRGYDTAVGEAGGYLSAGQRQRIGLARALYGKPKLLVLDEPNASLDPAGEEALGAALMAAKAEGAIVLVITHRSAVLRFCDEVIDLSQWRNLEGAGA
jgi:ATP-binding cassette subfamily C exporter for protease/lipase